MMMVALIALGIFTLLSLSTWLPFFWRFRKTIAVVAIPGLSVSIGLVFGLNPTIWTVIVVYLGIYQCINLLRLVEGRTRADYLYSVSLKSALWLSGVQLTLVSIIVATSSIDVPAGLLWTVVGVVQIVVNVVLYANLQRSVRKATLPESTTSIADRDLPTLTVCVPARNETDDLVACLNNLVHSNYPKLEILVLDDCSQNKKTPEILRNFAQKGVRFISGSQPPNTWHAKNHAYQQLAEAANGEILLFCGVDTRFEPNTLSEMIEVMIQDQKRMLSFLPVNTVPARNRLEDLMVQPGRYAWELTPPRRWLSRPPVLSTCWLIYAVDFKRAGTMKAVARSVTPEPHFANYAVNSNDSYGLLVATKQLGFRTEKPFNEQRATAIRTRYPQVHRRPELVAVLSVAEFAVLILPFIATITALIMREFPIAIIFGAASIIALATYYRVVALTYRKYLWRGLWLLPFAALYDIGLLNYSMWQYEFREVIWKGRNVCVPAMRIIPNLPKFK